MRCHMVVLTISLSVGFLDSLHDPSAYVAPHDISEAAVPGYEHTPGSQVPKVEIPQVVVACFLDQTPNCQTLYSMRASTSAVLPKPMLTGTHIQRPPF